LLTLYKQVLKLRQQASKLSCEVMKILVSPAWWKPGR